MNYSLSLTGKQYKKLKSHLFPGDNLEAVAIVLCHRSLSKKLTKFIAFETIPVQLSDCNERSAVRISWNTKKYLSSKKIEEMDKSGVSLFTIHSHPTGFKKFSKVDDDNDKIFFNSVYHWFNDCRPHGSAIILPDGSIFGRVFNGNSNPIELSHISIAGNSIKFFTPSKNNVSESVIPRYDVRVKQTFGYGTYNLLKNLKIGIVGCSGTGSIVGEILARNCVGKLVVVDPDIIEEKNLNRILNAGIEDAKNKKAKVDIFRDAVKKMGFDTRIEIHQERTSQPEVISALKDCDILFGCVDSAIGRYHLDCISSAYSIPYFDVGVQLYADKNGNISQALIASHYIQPGVSSLLSRRAYTSEQVTAESMKESDPERYKKELKEGYILNVEEDQPAVISINMQAACIGVNDFFARIHGYRLDSNDIFDIQRMSLTHGYYQHKKDDSDVHPLFSKDARKADKSRLIIKLIR